MVLWKYVVRHGVTTHRLPLNATVLSAGFVAGDIVVWAAIGNVDAVPVERHFAVVMTGEEDANLAITRFVGTVVCPDGFVAHVFDDA